ncbi:unnamed protein product, partial [Medioppia subpectinata]
SCWAIATVAAISDRICIASGGRQQPEISVEDALACNGFSDANCVGSRPDVAWFYYIREGVVSGGGYGSHRGCRPYSVPGTDPAIDSASTGPTPVCERQCIDGYNKTYANDKHYGSFVYGFDHKNREVQREIMTNGPVVAGFAYKSGVYQQMTGDIRGGHSVKIIKWGRESGVDYWLVANSWGTKLGDRGFFKIRRGND